MTTPSYAINWDAPVNGTSGNIAVGSVLVLSGSAYVIASAANRTATGRRADGIALTAWGSASAGAVRMQVDGTVPASITGLGTGTASAVRVSAAGALERVATPSASDDVVGYCETDGTAHVAFGVLTHRVYVDGSGGGSALADSVSVATYGALGNGTTDDSGAFRLAIDAAVTAGHRTVYVPPAAVAYRFASRVKVSKRVTIRGVSGARAGSGSKILLDAGLESAFTVVADAAAPGDEGASGAVIEGLEIECTPTVAVVSYAPLTAYTLGQLIKESTHNKHLYQVITAGTTSADNEATAFAPGLHVPDRADAQWSSGLTVYYGTLIRSTDPLHQDVVFMATTPASGAGSATTGATQPAWNYTPGTTTPDGSIVWTCVGDYTLTMGSVVCKVVTMTGIFVEADDVQIRDCRIVNPQCAAIEIIGNATNIALGNDARGARLEDIDIVLPGGGAKGLGVYTRGGQNRGLLGTNIRVLGSKGAGQGTIALPSDGTQNEHGILDESFLGGNTWEGCDVRFCGGYDYWAAGSSSNSSFVGCSSDSGRVRLDAAAQWVGRCDGTFWYSAGQGYGSTSAALVQGQIRNAKETTTTGVNSGLVAEPFLHYVYDPSDGGYVGDQITGGWVTRAWANVLYSAFAVSNRQVPNSTNNPNGEEGGVLRLPRGFGLGAASDYTYQFANATDYANATIRGGYRRVGDIVWRADRAAVGDYAADIVVTAGYTGPAWTAGMSASARITSGVTAHPATIVVPTNTGNQNAFECTVAGTADPTTEPTWSSAPAVGNTLVDGTITWTNVGTQPVLAVFGLIATPASTPFVPGDYGTVLIDLDAAHVTTSGSLVTAMVDQGPNAWNATAPGGSEPSYTASDASYNGKPTVNFPTGATKYLDTTSSIGTTIATNPITIFVAGHGTDNTVSGPRLMSIAGTADIGVTPRAAGSFNWTVNPNSGGGIAGAANSGFNPAVVGAIVNGASSKLYVDTKTAAAITCDAHSASGALRVGNYVGGASTLFTLAGPVARILIYSGAMSDANVQAVMTALGAMYGITIA